MSLNRRMRRLARLYRMTIATSWYDRPAGFQRGLERHYKFEGRGSPRTVRRTLVRRAMPNFQREIYRKYHKWIPLRQMRANFELEEEVAAAGQRAIEALGRSMRYHGREWSASPLAPKTIPYVVKRRKGAKKKHVSKKRA